MTHDEVMDAFEERAATAERAEQERAFRQAAGIFRDLSGAYSELAAKNPDAPDLFFAGMAHFYRAKAFRALYSAGEQERGSPSELYENGTQVVKFSRAGIQAFRSFGDAKVLDPDRRASEPERRIGAGFERVLFEDLSARVCRQRTTFGCQLQRYTPRLARSLQLNSLSTHQPLPCRES
jgi:hypothetical protein